MLGTRRAFALSLALPLLASAARASGFATEQEGVKAMGLAGAYTALAVDDPSALYYNVGGLALLDNQILTAGASAYSLQRSQYQGRPPGIGAGTTGQQEVVRDLYPHAYLALPFGTRAKIGVGVDSPFGFETDWSNPTTFPGRAISLTSQLRTYDLTTGFSWKVSPRLGIGLAAIYRSSDLANTRNIQLPDPVTGLPRDVASINAGTDFEGGFGWNVGILNRLTRTFSWGLSYRSPIDVTYQGSARLNQIATGNAQLDQLVSASLPLGTDLPIASEIRFPATAALGIAVGHKEGFQASFDLGWAQWSRFQGVGVAFLTKPSLSYVLQGTYDDAYSYRLGARYTLEGGSQFRFGAALEKTPQPDGSLSPFFVDADRTTVAAGYGLDWLDIALQWQRYDNRFTFTNPDGLNGLYRNEAWLLAVSITKFNR